jgi:hypothetical protein
MGSQTQASDLEEAKPVQVPESNVVDWDGPDDPKNPQNWSPKKRVILIALVSFITLVM